MDRILSIATEKNQPSLSYFRTKASWWAYLIRSPDEFERWYDANTEELAGFEVAGLIWFSSERRVAVMPFPQLSAEHFFDRDAP